MVCMVFVSVVSGQETLEMTLIREQSYSMDREMKLIATANLRRTIKNGNTKDEVYNILEYLAFEGILYKTMEYGRVLNNFPDVRAQVAILFGVLGTPRAQEQLVKMVNLDPDITVLIEAIGALGNILSANFSTAVPVIAKAVRRVDFTAPNNALAMTTLEAFEKMTARNNGVLHRDGLDLIQTIVSGSYITVVRNKARQLQLDRIRANEPGASR